MKRGPMGVRECDVSGCHLRWPCERHGTLTVGTSSATHGLSLTQACRGCGVHVCACETELGRACRGEPEPRPPAVVPASRLKAGDRVVCAVPEHFARDYANALRGRTFVVEAIRPPDGWIWLTGLIGWWYPEPFMLALASAAEPTAAKPKREWVCAEPGNWWDLESNTRVFGFRDAFAARVRGKMLEAKFPTPEAAMGYVERVLDELEAAS